MEQVKKLICIVLSLGITVMVCTDKDPNGTDLGAKRLVEPRLSDAQWRPCCDQPQTLDSCSEPADADKALALLRVARDECLGIVMEAVAKHAPKDLAAAYLIRAEREDDPVDLLRALETPDTFNRALAQERLGLTKEAIASFDAVVKERSAWSREARARRDTLQKRTEPEWHKKTLDEALGRRNRTMVTQLVRSYPAEAARYFDKSTLVDLEAAGLLADVLAENGDSYARAVVDAMMRRNDRTAIDLFHKGMNPRNVEMLERAATLLERAGNPMHLSVRYWIADTRFYAQEDALPLLDAIVPRVNPQYRELTSRIHILRGTALEYRHSYLQAHTAYEEALRAANGEPTLMAAALSRRSENYTRIGSPQRALGDSLQAIAYMDRVADVNARHLTYASAATAANALGHAPVALQYQNMAVAVARKALRDAPPERLMGPKKHLAVVLRARAHIHLSLGRDDAAGTDLVQAADLAASIDDPGLRQPLLMRVHGVRGEARLKSDPATAAADFTKAIELAANHDSTYRAVLHFNRAAAWRAIEDPRADADAAQAWEILRQEQTQFINDRKRDDYEKLWPAYFRRFQEKHGEIIESLIAAGDVEGALVHAEQTRAFEPMALLLKSPALPHGFRAIETRDDLLWHVRNLPPDTVILQYLVLEERTYAWVMTHEGIKVFHLGAGRKEIQRWVDYVKDFLTYGQRDDFTRGMRGAYSELFHAPLQSAPGRDRIVIIPDGVMHELPFNGLQESKGKYLIERATISTAGSAALYFFAVARDRQFIVRRNPTVLLVGDPDLHPQSGLSPVEHARDEVTQLDRDYYPGAQLLTGAGATIQRFLDAAKRSTIVHFAGHAITNPQKPWESRLYLAPQGNDSGELTAERLSRELSELQQTRLFVLGACSTAGGKPVGPEGLAPLVRPLIAANVPAVVGTLWDVNDATSKDLLVFLHCHYRRGDDVAIALRKAQLEMLRNKRPVWTWAAFQVVGYAGSPYAHHTGGTCNGELRTQDSLQRPDGHHPQ